MFPNLSEVRVILQKRKFLAVKVEFDEAETSALKHHNNEPYVDQVHTIRQATRWMTRFKTPTKDVTSYDMPWRAECRLRTRDVRMRLLIQTLQGRGTQGIEAS